uniref:Tc1-like transposase DDE domain-containing protein n=1 Tax=Oncorhynchus tshawytscha TaxID=74940 RepID=A0AAZ3PLW7_ONCTS
FTFQLDNNLKHKDKSTLQLLTKKTLNIPEWPSYCFDLNLLENLWQDLTNCCLAMINNQFDKA